MQRDRSDDGEEHAVGRRPQAGIPDALDRDRQDAAGGAGADPENRRAIGVQRLQHQHDRGDEGDRRRQGDQQPAFGKQLQVLVVRVVEEEQPRAFLIDEHRALEGAGADAGQRKVRYHPPGVVPDDRTAPLALLGRLPHAHREAAQVRVCRPHHHHRREAANHPGEAGAAFEPLARQHDEEDQADAAAEDAGARHRREKAPGHQNRRAAQPDLGRVDRGTRNHAAIAAPL